MFERFTMRARRAVVLAQEEARALHHGRIGTEHLVLGLLHEGEGRAAQALGALGLDLAGARAQVEAIDDVSPSEPSGHIPFDDGAKQALMAAFDECRLEQDEVITTGHVLLGLLAVPGGQACGLLAEHDIDRAAAAQALDAFGAVDEGPTGEGG